MILSLAGILFSCTKDVDTTRKNDADKCRIKKYIRCQLIYKSISKRC